MPLLFAYGINRFSHDVTQMRLVFDDDLRIIFHISISAFIVRLKQNKKYWADHN